jgi:transposase-like protein
MSTDKNGSNTRERRHFSPQQKVAIVKEHLVDGVPISDLCDRHHIQPAQFYLWQKQLFENGAAAFERKTKHAGALRPSVKSKRCGPSWAPRTKLLPS